MDAKTFPLRHISIRVPWHDSRWNGSVCQYPSRNTSCLKLTNIAEGKDEPAEMLLSGKSIKELEQAQFPPCLTERGTFMANFAITRTHQHPYVKNGKSSH